MNLSTVLIEIVNGVLNLYLAYWLFNSLWIRKYSLAITFFSCSILSIIYVIPLILCKGSFIQYATIFSTTIVMSFLFDSKNIPKLTFTALYYVFSGAIELIVAISITNIFNISFEQGKQGVLYVTGILLSRFFTFITISLVRMKRKKHIYKIIKKQYITVFTFPFATFAILVLQHSIFVYSPIQNDVLTIIVLFCYSLLIISNIMIFEFIDTLYVNSINESKLSVANEIISKQAEQYQMLITYNRDILKIQHDHKNFNLGILNELQNGHIQETINKIKNECEIINKEIPIRNDIIYALVHIKRDAVAKHNISIDLNYSIINKLSISSVDLAIILGNALDNAIEATLRFPRTEHKIIQLFVTVKHNIIVIIIKNPVLENVNTNNLTTSKDNSEQHGLGIISMKHLASKYNGEIVFDCKDNLFTTSIILNNSTHKIDE